VVLVASGVKRLPHKNSIAVPGEPAPSIPSLATWQQNQWRRTLKSDFGEGDISTNSRPADPASDILTHNFLGAFDNPFYLNELASFIFELRVWHKFSQCT
jgi:hypothetical protein